MEGGVEGRGNGTGLIHQGAGILGGHLPITPRNTFQLSFSIEMSLRLVHNQTTSSHFITPGWETMGQTCQETLLSES